MSDGPYKSLPMSPQWKKAVQYALQQACSNDEIALRMQYAIVRQCRSQLPRKVRNLLSEFWSEGVNVLFPSLKVEQCELLRCESAGHAFAVKTLDRISVALNRGTKDVDALRSVIGDSVKAVIRAALREIDEKLAATASDRKLVQERLHQAIESLGCQELADVIIHERKVSTLIPAKRAAIEDGPQIP